MNRQALDIYDKHSDGMTKYISMYGWHFNKKLCEFAVGHMRKMNTSSGKMEKIEPFSNEQMKELTKKYGIIIENDVMCDGLFVLNMCKADYYKKSISDEQRMIMYVQDTIDDADACDGAVMRKWYACMVGSGMPIDWEEML